MLGKEHSIHTAVELPAHAITGFTIAYDDVHVWCSTLDARPEHADRLLAMLSPDECARAERFHFQRDRRRFVVSRGLLRTVLSFYVNTDPALLRFNYGANGKPALEGYQDTARLHFNLAHSQELVLIAVATDGEVGVDVEFIRPIADLETIAEQVFSAVELKTLRQVHPDQRLAAFLQGWTRKEAYVKAVGGGLSIPLDSFDVTLEPGRAARILAVDGDSAGASAWSLYHLEPAPGYIGALAIRRACRQLQLWCVDIERLLIALNPNPLERTRAQLCKGG